MAETSYDEKTKLLGHNGHYHPPSSYSSGNINDDSVSVNTEGEKKATFAQASWLASVVYMALLVISGASMTLIISFQDNVYFNEEACKNSTATPTEAVPTETIPGLTNTQLPGTNAFMSILAAEPGACEKFHQPFVQLFQMGVGQVLTGLSFPFFRQQPGDASVPLADPGFWDFAPKAGLASLFDAIAEIFIILGISATYPSTAELMKATLVVFVGVASTRFFPGFALNKRQWLATAIMLAGATVAICQPYIDPVQAQEGGELLKPLEFVVGATMCLGAQMFYAMQFIVEEKLMDDCKLKHMHVNKGLLVFCEGWVSITCAIILQIPFTALLDPDGFNGFVADLNYYFDNPLLWATGIGLSASVSGFDIFGLLTAEHLGSDLRAVVTASFQVFIVWLVSAFWLGLEVASYVFWIAFPVIISAGFFYVFSSTRKEGPRHSDHGSKEIEEVA